MDFGFVSIPAIAIICYLLGHGIKVSPIDNKWIPTLAAFVGAILGVIAMYTVPDFPAKDILNAIGIGITSGAAATWIDQQTRQLTEK